MSPVTPLDLGDLGLSVLTHRERGVAARAHFATQLQRTTGEAPAPIVMPESVWVMTSSFFMGLFGPSVRSLGVDEFLRAFPVPPQAPMAPHWLGWVMRAAREAV